MTSPFTDSDGVPTPAPFRWTSLDLTVFGVFFALTVLFLPLLMFQVLRLFQPRLTLASLSGSQQVLLQAIMDLVLVGFIVFLIRVVHGLPLLATIRWSRAASYRWGNLAMVGMLLAVSVLGVSALFPPAEEPPIQKLITSSGALYLFALFGVGVAPLVEEIIFRGFLFGVIQDIRGEAAAVPATAALFTMLHIPQLWGSWAGILLIFLVGYVLSEVRRRSNSLIPS